MYNTICYTMISVGCGTLLVGFEPVMLQASLCASQIKNIHCSFFSTCCSALFQCCGSGFWIRSCHNKTNFAIISPKFSKIGTTNFSQIWIWARIYIFEILDSDTKDPDLQHCCVVCILYTQ